MADKKPYTNIIDAMLDEREPNWKDLGMEDAKKSGEDVADWSHQYVDTEFEDDIAESASRHTPVWGPKSGTHTYEERIAEKEAASPRINAVTANRRMNDYKSKDGDNDSLMDEVTESIEKAYTNSNLAENSAAKKEVSDAQVFKYIRDLLNQGNSPAKVAAKLEKLAEIELFNHQSATDYLQRNAGLMGLAYLEPNTYMDKSSPTYDHTASSKTANSFKVVMEENTSNAQRFATAEEAEEAANELASRWSGMPSDWRVEPSTDPVNYRFDSEQYRSVPVTAERTASKKTAGAPYGPDNLPPIDGENPPDDWEDCGSCGGYHPFDFYGDCRDDYNRWPSGYTTGEKPIDPNAVVAPRPMFGSSNACVQQKKAWDRVGIKPQAHSVKQVAACNGCTYFNQDARNKTCNLYHLPLVASAEELSQIVNHLTPGVPNNRKHAALVVLANGDDKRVQNPKVAEQTNVVKAADAKVRNQSKRASYNFGDNRESSKRFSSEHVAKLHGKGATLKQIYAWAEEKFGSVDTSFAFRGFVQSLKENAKGRIVVASADLSFLNSIGIRNAAFEGKEKCASCEYHKKALSPMLDYPETEMESDIAPCVNCDADQSHFTYDEHGEVFCTSCGEVQPISVEDLNAYQMSGKTSSKAGRVDQKFASKTVDVVRSKQAEAKEVTVTAAKVRILHQAGHSVAKIYKSAAGKVGSVEARKAVAGFIEGMKKKPGKIAVSESDRAFLVGKLGFKPEQVRMLDPQRRPVTQVVASVPDDQHLLSYPGFEKHAGEKKATDGHAILNEFDLVGSRDMQDIDTSGPKRDDVEMNDHFKVDLE
jgi:hypothetical protein